MSEALSSRGYISDNTGGGPTSPTLSVTINTIDILWTTNVNLTVIGQVVADWLVVALSGRSVSVLSVTQVSPTLTRLVTTDQTVGGSYVLDIPAAAVVDAVSGNPNAFFSLGFVGVGHLPSFVSAVPQTTTTVLATFSEPVVVAEALTPANYSVNNGLAVTGVTQVNDTQFLLTTSETAPGTIYTVTVSGIHDLAGNPVT